MSFFERIFGKSKPPEPPPPVEESDEEPCYIPTEADLDNPNNYIQIRSIDELKNDLTKDERFFVRFPNGNITCNYFLNATPENITFSYYRYIQGDPKRYTMVTNFDVNNRYYKLLPPIEYIPKGGKRKTKRSKTKRRKSKRSKTNKRRSNK
jgi:hypothetical protein